jgi:hypothetical protein
VVPATPTPSTENRVVARGVAPIVNNDEARARQNALRDAYRVAISQSSIEVGQLSEMRNFKELVDVVVTRSVGMVKSYKIMFEGRTKDLPPNYEVLIDAEVGPGSKADVMALALFLQVIENPTVLILMQELDAQPSLGTDEAETALARYFQQAGYTVLISADLLRGDPKQDQKVTLARQGYGEVARQLGVQHGADIVLFGTMKLSSSPMIAYDAEINTVHVTASVRAVVTGSGQVLAIEDSSYRTSGQVYETARTRSINAVSKELGEKLVWKIPEVLASQPRITAVTVNGCTLDEVPTIGRALREVTGVESVRTGAWTRQAPAATGKVTYLVSSGFVGATSEDLYQALRVLLTTRVSPDIVSRYTLEVNVHQGAPR